MDPDFRASRSGVAALQSNHDGRASNWTFAELRSTRFEYTKGSNYCTNMKATNKPSQALSLNTFYDVQAHHCVKGGSTTLQIGCLMQA